MESGERSHIFIYIYVYYIDMVFISLIPFDMSRFYHSGIPGIPAKGVFLYHSNSPNPVNISSVKVQLIQSLTEQDRGQLIWSTWEWW